MKGGPLNKVNRWKTYPSCELAKHFHVYVEIAFDDARNEDCEQDFVLDFFDNVPHSYNDKLANEAILLFESSKQESDYCCKEHNQSEHEKAYCYIPDTVYQIVFFFIIAHRAFQKLLYPLDCCLSVLFWYDL